MSKYSWILVTEYFAAFVDFARAHDYWDYLIDIFLEFLDERIACKRGGNEN